MLTVAVTNGSSIHASFSTLLSHQLQGIVPANQGNVVPESVAAFESNPESWRSFGVWAVISSVRSKISKCRCHTFLYEMLSRQPCAGCFEGKDTLNELIRANVSLSRRSWSLCHSDNQAPKRCIVNLLTRSHFRASPSNSERQFCRSGLRPWSSVSIAYGKHGLLDFRKNPHAYQDGRSDEASFEVLGADSSTT